MYHFERENLCFVPKWLHSFHSATRTSLLEDTFPKSQESKITAASHRRGKLSEMVPNFLAYLCKVAIYVSEQLYYRSSYFM